MKQVKNWKNLSVEIFILLLMKASTIQSACYWDSQNYCTISCTSSYSSTGQETISENMAQLEQKWTERSDCHDEGINLKLESLDYPSFVAPANFFTANVKVKELQFSGSSVTVMQVNALMANAFKSVRKLVLTSTRLEIFPKGLFNGLESLEILNIKGVSWSRQKFIEKGVLDILNETLTEFTFEQLTKSSDQILIDGFTGSEVLPKLTSVKYMYNLESSITRNSFGSLKSVRTLDLSDCQIATIHAGAFDPISSTIEVLKLENNVITTLPYGLFDPMLPSYSTYIFLEGNRKWVCDCDLMPFKITLLEHFNFIGAVECNLPQTLRSYKVNETDFCDEYVPPITSTPTTVSTDTSPTTEITTKPTTTPTTVSTNPLPDEFPQECFPLGETDEVSKMVAIKTPSQSLSINENENGDIVLQADKPMENRVLIWFSLDDRSTYFRADNEINCLIASGTSIPITNLMETSSSVHTFCLMNSMENTVSPLDCISYAKRDNYLDEKPWLYESSKSFVIGMIAIVCIVSVLIGVAFGYFTFRTTTNGKKNLDSTNNIGITDVLKEAFNSSIMRKQNRLSNITDDSYITKRTTNTTLQYFADSNYIAPPLPARPSSMYPFEEPVYATVGDHK